MSSPVLIAVDWGSSNFRAYLCSASGKVIAKVFFPNGIFKLNKDKLEQFLQRSLKDWLVCYPSIPIIFCGMVGSRSGIVETDYLPCPLPLSQLASSLVKVESAMQRQLRIVPGVAMNSGRNSLFDVMRGEETQLVGVMLAQQQKIVENSNGDASFAIKELGQKLGSITSGCVVCMPGTHCKWAHLEGATVHHFRTFMTGEIYAMILKSPSIISQLVGIGYQAKTVWEVFSRGIDAAKENKTVLADLFNIRAQLLLQSLQPVEVRDYLSGLLIAHEIMQAKRYIDLGLPIVLVAGGMLADRYQAGFAKFGLQVQIYTGEEVTQRGLFYLAQQAKLI
jgi:2-dehydro-3-deoxygalactonokinase